MNRASDLVTEFDTNHERAHVFQNSIRTVSQPYKTLLQLESEKLKKQQSISHFFTKEVETNHVSKKKDINNSNIASLFSKQMAKSNMTNNARKSPEKKKPYQCDICHARFTENELFIDHLSSVHEGNKHDEGIQMCHKCSQLATHFCKTCQNKLCKFCIIKHYSNTEFTKDHEMVPI